MSQDTPSQFESAEPFREDEDTAISEPKSPVRGLRSYNIVVDGKRTSIRLDPISIDALREISRRENILLNDLCTMIFERNKGNDFTFTAAIRIFLLSYYKKAATEEGHQAAGHGLSRPLAGTPFEEAASLKAKPSRPRATRGRPPQSAKSASGLPLRPGEPGTLDLPAG